MGEVVGPIVGLVVLALWWACLRAQKRRAKRATVLAEPPEQQVRHDAQPIDGNKLPCANNSVPSLSMLGNCSNFNIHAASIVNANSVVNVGNHYVLQSPPSSNPVRRYTYPGSTYGG